jgi:hypothetical protein
MEVTTRPVMRQQRTKESEGMKGGRLGTEYAIWTPGFSHTRWTTVSGLSI